MYLQCYDKVKYGKSSNIRSMHCLGGGESTFDHTGGQANAFKPGKEFVLLERLKN
jgi:hypothetical protein